jgi:hypothetical protein
MGLEKTEDLKTAEEHEGLLFFTHFIKMTRFIIMPFKELCFEIL